MSSAVRLQLLASISEITFANPSYRYSVGTGRPAIFAPIYIDSPLLESFDAVVLDGFDVSSVMLFSSLQGLHAAPTSNNFDVMWAVLQQWRKQWAHLFGALNWDPM